jgi:hypothetical protein
VLDGPSDPSTVESEAKSVASVLSPFPLKLPLADGDKAQLIADQASTSLLALKPSLHEHEPDEAAVKRAYGDTAAIKTAADAHADLVAIKREAERLAGPQAATAASFGEVPTAPVEKAHPVVG